MDYERFSEAFHDYFTSNPNACVYLGIERRLDDLPDPSASHAKAMVSRAGEHLAQLSQIDQSTLNFSKRLDLDLAKLELEREIFNHTYTFNGRTTLEQTPSAGDDIGDGIFMLFANDPRPADVRLANISERLSKVPDYLGELLTRLDQPVQRWVNIDRVKVEGLPSFFQTIERWADQTNYADLAILKQRRIAAEAALSKYAEALGCLPTTPHFHLDEATAQRIIHLRGIERTTTEVHGIAKAFLRDNVASIESLKEKLIAKHGLSPNLSVEALQAWLNRKYRTNLPTGKMSDILQRYQEERRRILSFIEDKGLFPVFEGQDMKIIQTPAFMTPSIPAGAMMSPPPFRSGVKTSMVYLTLSEELLDEHTELSIPNMMIHEGIPGHHLHLATAANHPSTIRRHIQAMDQAEGWTTMLEDYMLDVGYMGELADEARFCAKRDIARIGARVAIDLFFMTGNSEYLDVGTEADISPTDPFEAAGNLLHSLTGFTPARLQAELNWYSQERGYPLSYLTGNALVWKLKRDAYRSKGEQMSEMDFDRMFHKVFLDAGSMPVSYLRRVFIEKGLLPTAPPALN